MGGTIGLRRPRRTVPEMPGGELVPEPPPEPERPVPGGLAQRLLPLAMVGGAVLFVVLGRGDTGTWLFGGMFALSALGMLLTGGGRGAGARTATMDEDRRDYLRYLEVLGGRAAGIAARQRRALETVHPDPGAWPDVLAAGRLWERRPADDDFGRLRAGRGTQRLAARLSAPHTGPLESLEPLSALALRRFLRRHSTVDDLPVAVDARASATIWVEPDGSAAAAAAVDLARALVVQYVLWHGPDDARLAVVAPGTAAGRWDWVKWLPHAGHPALADAVGPLRMLTDDPDRVRRWWVDEPSSGDRHLLVVLDGAADTPGAWAGVPGVTVLRIGPARGRRPAVSVLRLAVGVEPGGARTLRRGGPGGTPVGVPDAVTGAEARALARRLARYRPDGPADAAGPDGPVDVRAPGLGPLLGLGRPDRDGIAALRGRRGPADRLRVPLGTDPAGRPVVLDLKESAQGGAGPHGLCIGATGSGNAALVYGTLLPMATGDERRAAIYCRISRDKTGGGLGVERQESDCRELAERHGWALADTVYVDNDLSAYSGKNRPAYRQLLADIEAGHITMVLCWHTDRLHRSPLELEEWISVCEPRNVEVHTVKAGPIDLATPSGRMVARQLGAVARYESEHRSERVTAALQKIITSGGFTGGARPFGYTANGLDIVPKEADLIRTGTEAIIAGRSLRSLVVTWNEAGTTTTRSNKKWVPSAVRDVLTRARNAGLVQHAGAIVGKGQWPAIVTEAQWRTVTAILNDPKRRTSPGNRSRWLGSNIYRCGVKLPNGSMCGAPMVVGTTGNTRNPSYRCTSVERGGIRHVTRAAPTLDEFVQEVLIAKLSMPDAAEAFAPAAPTVDVHQAAEELARIATEREELGARLGRGDITLSMLDAANAGYAAREAELQAQIAQATPANPIAHVITAGDVRRQWFALDVATRRDILNSLYTVTVLPAPRGRRPDGDYFDADYVRIEPRTQQ